VVCQEWLEMQVCRGARFGRSVVAPTSRRTDSEEPGMLRSRLVLATFLVVTCAACSHEEASPARPPSPDPTTSTPSAPTSSVPPELAGYDEKERAAYDLSWLRLVCKGPSVDERERVS